MSLQIVNYFIDLAPSDEELLALQPDNPLYLVVK